MRSLAYKAKRCRCSVSAFCCLLGLWFGWSEIPAAAASFDCQKASTEQEKAICTNAKLSKLDEELVAAYDKVRTALSPAGAAEVREDQRQWLTWLRQVCRNWGDRAPDIADCLTDEYEKRLTTLTAGNTRLGGMVFFPRLKVTTRPNTRKSNPYSPNSDPPFGRGWFGWPEIDRPTAQQAAWNSAVRERVLKAPGVNPANVADENIATDYQLNAANEILISVDVDSVEWDYGNLQPALFWDTFQWWVKLGRELTAEDIFVPGSGWEKFLEQRCYEQLRRGEHAEDLYDKETVRQGVRESGESEGWRLDAQKFARLFDRGRVGSIGFTVELDWKELSPYLAKGFNPATLPLPAATPEVR